MALATLATLAGGLAPRSADAQDGLTTYLSATIAGDRLDGGVTARGFEGSIECQSFGFQVQQSVSVDPRARSTAAPVYSPITCSTSFDATTVEFWRALTLGLEVEASFDFLQLDRHGTLLPVFSIDIGMARVTAVRVFAHERRAEVEFEYADIMMGHPPTGMEHTHSKIMAK